MFHIIKTDPFHVLKFSALNQYLEASQFAQEATMNFHVDQKVPQKTCIIGSESLNYPNTVSEGQFTCSLNTFLENMGEFAPRSQTVVPVMEAPQEFQNPESPKSFIDMDSHNEPTDHDISLYDPNCVVKTEKNYVPCSMSSVNIVSNLPNFCSINNESYVQPVKTETLESLSCADQFGSCDIGSAVVVAIKNEINQVCRILGISPDPRLWSESDVLRWMEWHGNQFHASYGVTEAFRMCGAQLCRLSNEAFKRRSPEAGANLYAQLDVWKNACSLPNPQIKQTTPDFYYPPAPQESFMPTSLSPTPSATSEESCRSSSPISSHSDEEVATQNYHSNVNSGKQTIHLWEFLKELLLQPDNYSGCIKWVSRTDGIFKIEDSSRVARLWGKRKNRPAMNYDKLSRSIRQYYKKGIIKKTEHSKRLVYQFCQPYL
ncbi:SAM pointed domain-containing Ets transcription factor-like isoform X2 [Saccostrea echinata]|uniref:SAM pointed domain-containing Ets transcription factor-like isoform X2 n=1 Tax=Saccostrea echinata TaxID=191078 RepID=UPI002A7F58B7|nr:SAM pointed domain-containing Ets transcription factor-like isoform X2 [Saccostrea echinata]